MKKFSVGDIFCLFLLLMSCYKVLTVPSKILIIIHSPVHEPAYQFQVECQKIMMMNNNTFWQKLNAACLVDPVFFETTMEADHVKIMMNAFCYGIIGYLAQGQKIILYWNIENKIWYDLFRKELSSQDCQVHEIYIQSKNVKTDDFGQANLNNTYVYKFLEDQFTFQSLGKVLEYIKTRL
jgi:hypothetical protein